MPRKKGPVRTAPVFTDDGDPRGHDALIVRYFEWMRIRGYSEATVNRAEEVLCLFVRWCRERGIDRPQELTRPILERYQRHLYHYRKRTGEPLSFRGQHSQLCAIQGWFRFLARQNYILNNPASDLDLPRLGKRLPRFVLNVPEVEQVLAGANLEEPKGIRDRTIMETLYSTGIRRSELINLRLFDVDTTRGTLMIREGKGRRDRMIPIGERALAWIQKYIDDVRPLYLVEPDDGTLFLTVEGERFSQSHLTKLIRTYVNASGVGKKGSCHLFRHSMATLMLEGGADIRFIQQMLGHAELNSTEIYTQVGIRQLKEVYKTSHPGAHLARKARPATEEHTPTGTGREEDPDAPPSTPAGCG